MSRIVKNASLPSPASDVPFGSNAVRLTLRQWLAAGAVIGFVLYVLPRLWIGIEPLKVDADYRIPYSLGQDYWMYQRVSRATAGRPDRILVVGDSVVWGHYVAPDETLSHYLNEQAGENRFVNLGVDGIHPAAMQGLLQYYGRSIRNRDVILHCNLLWLSSPRHDLQLDKEFAFNHPCLVPQFYPRIPCYRASVSQRLAIAVQRHLPFAAWSSHIRTAYFAGLDVPTWTLDRPYENPLCAVTLKLPPPDELPSPPPVAKSWTAQRLPKFNASWVTLDGSIQWAAFQRTVGLLRSRGNRVFVMVGPLNEPMLTEESLAAYQQLKQQATAWLVENGVPCFVPDALPSDLYADASHPLAEGYALLAARLSENEPLIRLQMLRRLRATRDRTR